MNKVLIAFMCWFLVSCANSASQVEGASEAGHEQHDTAKSESKMALNNGMKWKADESTRKNVAAMIAIVNDSSGVDINNRKELTKNLEAGIDTLVQECKMQGPDHEALHVWLKQVLHDLKELKEEDNSDAGEFKEAYAELKSSLASFYDFFE